MPTKLKHTLSLTPTPIAGLALGLASLGLSWQFISPNLSNIQLVLAFIASILLVLLLTKFVLHPALLLADLKHPLLSSVLPTSSMALMVISVSVREFSQDTGTGLWLIATGIHGLFLLCFIYFRLRDFALEHMAPSWFVPPIGIIVAAVCCPSANYLALSQLLLWFGISCYGLMLPVMLYRLILCTPLIDAAKPTLAIMAAPASLSLAGYLSVISEPSLPVILLLLGIALLMTLLIYFTLFHLLRQPFSPGFAAFTFPLVIGATALFKVSDCCFEWPVTQQLSRVLHQIAIVELVVATLMVVYVSYCYLSQWRHIYADSKHPAK
ncbi:TDT family transporter [Neptunicella marina]|uniref:TDT family transporter n=1 Tax=Neptunicella marina TaxID=2125989 RepID=A0A8J6ITP8_9ALTE|nr:TDT family transporter [Neptunicella marina]MBC3766139.1 TDT family transporter [Neptunicella marina]